MNGEDCETCRSKEVPIDSLPCIGCTDDFDKWEAANREDEDMESDLARIQQDKYTPALPMAEREFAQ